MEKSWSNRWKRMVSGLATAKKIELFARNHREGWDAFGNQIEGNE